MTTAEEMIEAEKPIGAITWYSSEEDGGPDVGISLTLANGKELWCGEITNAAYKDAGAETLGADGGWWIILYEKDVRTVIGKCLEEEAAHSLLNALASAIKGE